MLQRGGKRRAYRHTFRNIMQRHRENEFGSTRQTASRSFAHAPVDMLMRHDHVEQQQKQYADGKTDNRRYHTRYPLLAGHFHRGYKQRPHRGGDHHTGGEPGECFLQQLRHFAPHQKHTRRSQCRSGERQHQANCKTIHIIITF